MTGPIARVAEESLFDVILSRPITLFGAAGKLPKNILQREGLRGISDQFETGVD